MKENAFIKEMTICFGYNQFLVYDPSADSAGCDWTEQHCDQGFARREQNVAFGTLIEFGFAIIRVYYCKFIHQADYERIISVPFKVATGEVVVCGPEEIGLNRNVKILNGNYRLVAAQRVLDGETEEVDLFFEKLVAPDEKSQIILADDALHPSFPLLETVGIP